MKCEDCIHYITYIRWRNNGYIDMMIPMSHCEVRSFRDVDEENCKEYEKRGTGDE